MRRAAPNVLKSIHLSRLPPPCSPLSLLRRNTSYERVLRPEDVYTDLDPHSHIFRAFSRLGLRDSVLGGIRNFPQVDEPSVAQQQFIPAVARGDADVFIRDGAGSGKSFGLVMSLLSKQRAGSLYNGDDPTASKKKRRRCITSIIIVPHASLAMQLMEWIRTLTPPELHQQLPAVAQVLLRGIENKNPFVYAQELAANPPHILIATPGALLDVWREYPTSLSIRALRTIVLDEADYLLGFGQQSKKSMASEEYERPLHPPDAMVFMDELFAARPKCVPLARYAGQDVGQVPLQVVLASATFPLALRDFVVHQTEWIRDSPRPLVKVGFTGADTGDVKEENVPAGLMLGGPGLAKPGLVKHHCLVVRKDGEMTDLDAPSIATQTSDRKVRNPSKKPVAGPSTPPDVLLECVAACVALDVEKLALLVLEDGASVTRTVAELRSLGVNAVPLDLTVSGQETFLRSWTGNVTLLISTRATTRGIDLPVSHVFILGVPDNAFIYRHLAGRVGRRGTEGRVVEVISASAEDEVRMRDVYRRLRVVPEKYEPGVDGVQG